MAQGLHAVLRKCTALRAKPPRHACSESVGLQRVAAYWHNVIQVNDYQKHRFVERVIASMFNTVSGKAIALLGFAFKKVRPPAAHSQD